MAVKTADPIAEIIRNLFALNALGNGISVDADRLLRSAFDEIAGRLTKYDPSAVARAYQQVRLDKFLKETDEILKGTNAQVFKQIRNDLIKLGHQQGTWASASMLPSTGLDVGLGFVAGPGPAFFKTVVDSKPFQGLVLKDWADGLTSKATRDIQQQIQLGLTRGESIGDLVRRVRGTAVDGVFKGGVLETTTREATSIVRTAVSHVASEAHMETYRQNDDIIIGYRFTAVLDSRTSLICASLDGTVWSKDDEDIEYPPLHYNCRSMLMPIIEGLELPNKIDYSAWLRDQSMDKQDDILGPSRADLFRAGMPLKDMVRSDNTILRLEELVGFDKSPSLSTSPSVTPNIAMSRLHSLEPDSFESLNISYGMAPETKAYVNFDSSIGLPMVNDSAVKAAQVEVIDIRRIFVTADSQEFVEKFRVSEYIQGQVKLVEGATDSHGWPIDKPLLYERPDGKYVILDGHHKYVADRLLGKEAMEAYIVKSPTKAVANHPIITKSYAAPGSLSNDKLDKIKTIFGGTKQPGVKVIGILHEMTDKAGDYAIDMTASLKKGVRGQHIAPSPTQNLSGWIRISPEARDDFEKFLNAWNTGARTVESIGTDGLRGLRTVLHETVHASSGMNKTLNISKRLARPGNNFIEEGIVERKTRHSIEKLVPGSTGELSKLGNYAREVASMDAYAARYGEEAVEKLFNANHNRVDLVTRKILEDIKKTFNSPPMDDFSWLTGEAYEWGKMGKAEDFMGRLPTIINTIEMKNFNQLVDIMDDINVGTKITAEAAKKLDNKTIASSLEKIEEAVAKADNNEDFLLAMGKLNEKTIHKEIDEVDFEVKPKKAHTVAAMLEDSDGFEKWFNNLGDDVNPPPKPPIKTEIKQSISLANVDPRLTKELIEKYTSGNITLKELGQASGLKPGKLRRELIKAGVKDVAPGKAGNIKAATKTRTVDERILFHEAENKEAHLALTQKRGTGHAEAVRAKKEIVGNLTEKLKDHPQWKDVVRILERNGWTPDTRSNPVDIFIRTWAQTSADHNPLSLALQRAVAEEFNLKDYWKVWDLKSLGPSTLKNTEGIYNDLRDFLHKFVRAQYDETQKFFKDHGITHISIFRGMDPGVHLRGLVDLELQPASSFSPSLGVANRFTSSYGTGVTVVMRVPVSMVIGSARTGWGCLNELEYVILGGRYKGYAFKGKTKLDVIKETMKKEGVLATGKARKGFIKQIQTTTLTVETLKDKIKEVLDIYDDDYIPSFYGYAGEVNYKTKEFMKQTGWEKEQLEALWKSAGLKMYPQNF